MSCVITLSMYKVKWCECTVLLFNVARIYGVASLFYLGLISRQEGDIQGSLELFQKAVKLSPNSAACVKQVARSLYVSTCCWVQAI